jgi:amidohydrolase
MLRAPFACQTGASVNRILQTFRLAALALIFLLSVEPTGVRAAAVIDDAAIEAATVAVTPQVVAWRRDIHQNPELSNREVRTSKLVAEQLRKLGGIEVKTGVAHTGVVGVLKGGRPGPTIALRADMDALPVTEQVDVPFKSVATAEYRGETVGVMHACGHDGHTAILLGTAKILAGLRKDLPGTVVFLFQPAEEGPPDGEEGGAKLMLAEGVFSEHRPEAAFGLHLWSALSSDQVGYRAGPMMAGSDAFRIVVKGRQTHGARPWGGIDPIVTASQIVLGLQTIVARQLDITEYPAIVSVGVVKGGIRYNIIPDSVELVGTFRTFGTKAREQTIESIKRIATDTAAAAGATAEFELSPNANPALVNDTDLTPRAVASLARVAGNAHVKTLSYMTVSEDFSYFANEVPSFFYFVGSTPQGTDPVTAPSNHSPKYFVDETALPLGVKTLTTLALDYLQGAKAD